MAIHETPFSSVDASGQPEGFYVDIVEHIGSSEGWELEYAIGTWSELLFKFV